jgi:hypothetical protein
MMMMLWYVLTLLLLCCAGGARAACTDFLHFQGHGCSGENQSFSALRGLSRSACITRCVNIGSCKSVEYYPSLHGGASHCSGSTTCTVGSSGFQTTASYHSQGLELHTKPTATTACTSVTCSPGFTNYGAALAKCCSGADCQNVCCGCGVESDNVTPVQTCGTGTGVSCYTDGGTALAAGVSADNTCVCPLNTALECGVTNCGNLIVDTVAVDAAGVCRGTGESCNGSQVCECVLNTALKCGVTNCGVAIVNTAEVDATGACRGTGESCFPDQVCRCIVDTSLQCSGVNNCGVQLPQQCPGERAGNARCDYATQRCHAVFKSARVVLDGPTPALTTTDADAVLRLPRNVKLTPGTSANLAHTVCSAARRGELFMEVVPDNVTEDVLHVCAWDGSVFRFRRVVFDAVV